VKKAISTRHGALGLPVFLPDATRGIVRGLDTRDLEQCGVSGLVVNTYHLMLHPGSRRIQQLGGCHQFMNWQKPILTDSGGFQIFSLIHQNPKYGTIRKNEIIFRSAFDQKKQILTPEKSIRIQANLGADILMCLDDCPHPAASASDNLKSVERTIAWAQLCKAEFEEIYATQPHDRPLVFGIIQGGNDRELRQLCAEALIGIGFDGFGFGGWPLDDNQQLLEETLALTAQLMPDHLPKYAMGIGKPENIVACIKMGYKLFDCALPTRDARHGRLFAFSETNERVWSGQNFYKTIYLQDSKHLHAAGPISENCDCYSCQNYSLAYLHHLYMIRDSLAKRLATIHNLRFYTRLMDKLSTILNGK